MQNTHNPLEKETSVETYLQKGHTFFQKEEYQSAILEYSNALNVNSQYVDAYNYRGIAKNLLGQYFEAIDDFDQALEKDPRPS